MNKMSAIVPMLALVALAACGDKDGMIRTPVWTPPPSSLPR